MTHLSFKDLKHYCKEKFMRERKFKNCGSDETEYTKFTLAKFTKHKTIWTNYPSPYSNIYQYM